VALLRVLLVDDEVDLVESLAMALEGQCDVLTAKNGAEALEVILTEGVEKIDAIVLDLMMPVMSGEELISELRRRAIGIPVIVASASRNVAERCEELGVEHCLQKPYRLHRLLDHLKSVSSSRS
jgi:two-component system capsular synthesis sensor histidine kinase RcsC